MTAASKIVDEHLALAYAHQEVLPVTVVRLFSTFGPRQTGQYGMVVHASSRRLSRASRSPFMATGSSGARSRAWAADGVVDAMIALVQHPDAAGQAFNVGHTKDISVFEFALLVRRLAASDSEIVQVPFEQAYEPEFEHMARRLPDTRRSVGSSATGPASTSP